MNGEHHNARPSLRLPRPNRAIILQRSKERMKRTLIYIFAAVLILTLTLSGCKKPEEKVICGQTGSQGMQYQISVLDKKISAIIESNMTTGYGWVYEISDTDVIESVSDEYTEGVSGLEGAAGEHDFVFRVKENGHSSIEFRYEKSWEDEPAERFAVSIMSKGGKVEVTVVDGESVS